MNFLGKNELRAIDIFNEHLEEVDNTLKKMLEMLKHSDSSTEKTSFFAGEVRKCEKKADECRRRMESEMYQGTFLPNFRGDLLGIIETVDLVANRAESVADDIDLQNLEIPKELLPGFIKLAELSKETFNCLRKAAEMVFNDLEEANRLIFLTEETEDKNDCQERELIKIIFESKISLPEKIQLKLLAEKISQIADDAENASDRIQIVVFKRRI